MRKTEITLYESCVEYTWSDQDSIVKNHVDQCVELHYLLNNISLGPALFPDANNIGSTDKRNSRINLVIAQPAITCSNLTIKTLKQGVKNIQS